MTLARLFDAVARAHPGELAIVSSRGSLTYAGLRAAVERLARRLVSRGVALEVPVGIAVPRSPASMIAAVAVLRAGGAYVPIDPAYPAERQRWMADDAGIRALIVDATQGSPPSWADPAILVDVGDGDGDDDDDVALPEPPDTPDALLYLLYTSGSTGRPKGVCGTHAATLNRVRWGWDALPFTPGEVVGHRSSLNFVDAAPEMFSGLLHGVPTAVLLPEELADLGRLVDALRRHRVTRLTVVPSILAALLRAAPDLGEALAPLRTWITSGEELPLPLLHAFRTAHPTATLVNIYGTTEVTGDVTFAAFAPESPLPTDRVPIGAAMAGAELWILDPAGAPVGDGEAGELHVGGPVLARGYHRRPADQAVRFPVHPTRPGDRVFRTGDLVRRDAAGALHYLGRVDNLVKVRGVRIELEEIERNLRGAIPGVEDVAVVLAEDQLVAFVTPADADTGAVRRVARERLPAAMLPSRVLALAALPLSPNGKCDRKALVAAVRSATRTLTPEQRPATATERRLADLWAPLLRRDDIGRDDSFAGLGGDSLGLAELSLTLERGPGKIELGLLRDGSLARIAAVLDGEQAPAATMRDDSVTITALSDGADDPEVIAMLLEASADASLCAATELPGRMDAAAARAYCRRSEGVVIRLRGEPVGAGVVQREPNLGEGVVVPAGAVQLDEWLLPRFRSQGILGEGRAWPLLAEWLAARFDHEVSVVWEDHLAMLAILRARGYTRVGRSYWRSTPEGDGTEGYCEVWLYDLRAHR